jgi:hypothetical protein
VSAEAVKWLEADFDWTRRHWLKMRLEDRLGVANVRAMAELLSVMDAGEPMRICRADYTDRERWWL